MRKGVTSIKAEVKRRSNQRERMEERKWKNRKKKKKARRVRAFFSMMHDHLSDFLSWLQSEKLVMKIIT